MRVGKVTRKTCAKITDNISVIIIFERYKKHTADTNYVFMKTFYETRFQLVS